jgi:soluble lytic murein transglycosylase-like protein
MKKLVILPLIYLILICSIFIFTSQAFAIHKDTIPFDNAYQVISNYGETITRASKLFDVPEKIIIGVILTESGGDPLARAKTSSAKGLMQTIDSTFNMAYNALKVQGINIVKDPFDPTASILAGSWYLGSMYDQAVLDLKADFYKKSLKSLNAKVITYQKSKCFNYYNRSFDKGFD